MGSALEEIKGRLVSMAAEIQSMFPDLYLAGGTAIMLKYGHRISYDLDFFSEKSDLSTLLAPMIEKYEPEIERIVRFSGGDNVDVFVRGTKVSFVRFPFRNVEPTESHSGIRMASDMDLLLNKIYVAGRRVESKDPADIACLLQRHPEWRKIAVGNDFHRKFKDEKFEIYFASVLAFEDFPGLDDETKKTLELWSEQE
jgi:predicted nucleotidyltransferase component of viral defense system